MLKINGRHVSWWRPGVTVTAGLVLLTVTGCSVPNVFGSDNSPLPLPPPLEVDADGVAADKTGRKGDSEAGATPASKGETETADSEEYPDLADVPEGAEATKAAEKAPEAQTQRDQLANELVADREKSKYTDEELRGGRVAAVAPPRPQAPSPPRPAAPPANVEITPPPAAPVAQAKSAPARAPIVAAPAAPPVIAPAPAPVIAAPIRPVAPRSLSSAVQTAPAYSSSSFQPSTAPPLSADLVASLPAGVAQRYQETLRSPVPGIPAALPVAPVLGSRAGAPDASIQFASGSSQLSPRDKSAIAQVVSAARNGFGVIRVVGHASSTTSSQSESQRMIANWEVSQARATSVADALVSQGVDAARIIIEAVGDSQSASAAGYPDREAAARRVDLFLE